MFESIKNRAFFDKIYIDDGITPLKPHPFCADDFAAFTGVKKERIVMVGDTVTDLHFADNAGIPLVALAKDEKRRALLQPKAAAVIADIAQLLQLLQ